MKRRVSGVLWRSKVGRHASPPGTLQAVVFYATPGEVYRVDVYARVRRAVHVDGMSIPAGGTRVRSVAEDDLEEVAVCTARHATSGRSRSYGRNWAPG